MEKSSFPGSTTASLQRCGTTAFADVSQRDRPPSLLGGQIPQGRGLVCSDHHPPDRPCREVEVEGSQVLLSRSSFAARWVPRHTALGGCTMLWPKAVAGRRKGYLGLLSFADLNLSKWWIYTTSSSYFMGMWTRGSMLKMLFVYMVYMGGEGTSGRTFLSSYHQSLWLWNKLFTIMVPSVHQISFFLEYQPPQQPHYLT